MSDRRLSRRELLAGLGAAGAGALSYAAYLGSERDDESSPGPPPTSPTPELTAEPTNGTNANVADIRSYDAAIDGVTDDAGAIRSALEDVAPDGVVLLPPGDIVIDTPDDAPGAVTLGDDHRNVTIMGSVLGSHRTRLLLASGQDEVHYGVHVTGQSMRPSDVITLANLTIDLDAPTQSGVGTAILTDGAAGTLRMRDCRVTSTRNSGLKMEGGMNGDVQHCAFEDNGVDAFGHAISPNQTARETTTTIRHVYCANQRGVSIDVGTDANTDMQTVTVDRCVLENSMGGIKVDPTAASVTIKHTQLLGDGSTRIPVKMNPFDFRMGEITLDNVLIDQGGWPGIDFPNAATLTLRDVAILNVDKDDTERGIARGGIRTEDLDFGDSGRVSIHSVGANEDGPALNVFDGAGSIEEVIHGRTGGLGRTEGVTVRKESSGSPLTPDVATMSEVGPRNAEQLRRTPRTPR